MWLAEEPNFGNRQVPIKEPHSGLGSTHAREIQERFQREVKISAALKKADTPHVVRAITAEPYEDGLLLVLDYMPGGDLEQHIAAHPEGLPLAEALAIAQDILTALSAVHENRMDIVHRDIKPTNILFDAGGRAYLGDFGLAQVAGWSAGRSQMMGGPQPGTPLYMAPEQATNMGYLTPTADIFAFGCVLFEMLTGQKYKRYQPGTRPGSLRADVPDWLDTLLAKAVMENQWERWQNGGEMLAAWRSGEAAEGVAREEAAERKRREAEKRALWAQQEAERKQKEQAAAHQARLEQQRREAAARKAREQEEQ